MKKPGNPFVLAGFVSKDYFCDREKELAWLKDQFLNERNMVLYSWRRMGKTSLIQCFSDQGERALEFETIYVDLMSTQSMEDAIRSIARAVHQKYGRTTGGISKPLVALLARLGLTVSFDPVSGIPKLSFGLSSPIPPEESLQALGEFLDGRKKKVLIVLDEFQQITRYPEKNGEAVFRSWMQRFPKVRFIFSGSQRNLMRSIFSDQNRPFYRSTQLYGLQPIPRGVYGTFIREHFKKAGLIIEDKTVEAIYTWSRGQTYTIQLICNKAFALRRTITQKTLEAIYYEIIEQEKPVFYNYMKMLTKTQWEVLKAIAVSEPAANPYSTDFIQKNGLGAASSVSTALGALLEKEMVIEENNQYLLHDVILARWFQQQP